MKITYHFSIIAFLATIPTLLEGAFCHRNWISYESKCYRFISLNKSFYDADLFCLVTGNRLASISSQGLLETLAMNNMVKDTEISHFWVGLERKGMELIWKDGTSANNQSWVDPHSVPFLSTRCFVFNAQTNSVEFKLCLAEQGFICESNKTMFDPIENCKEGQTEHSFIGEATGRCYYRLPITTIREKVENACSNTGGGFMDIDDIMYDGMNEFYDHKVMTNDGLRYWTYLTWNGSHILWKSGDVLQQHFPFVQGNGECITVAFNFTDVLETHLFQTECNNQAHIICSVRPETLSTTTAVTVQPRNIYCPQGHNWKSSSVTGACYWETSYETNRLSWDDARNYCQGFGGDLASFHSVDEEKIGLSFQYGSLAHPYWIGLRLDLATETYKWSDGTPLDYENWAPNHPNHRDKRLQCVSMDAKSKHWTSSLCGIISWFVCQSPKRADPYVPVIPTRPPLVKCEYASSDTYYFQGYCYNIVNAMRNWHRAKQYCENQGSSLVSIHSDEEVGFLLRMLYDDKDTRGNRVWIGMTSLYSGAFRWTDGTPIDYTYWNENEPNNYQNQEKCCNMYMGNGLWNDENCQSDMGFICKQNRDATTTQIPTTIDPRLGNCKKGWFPYHDRCYLLRGTTEKDRLNWTEASAYCTKEGGYITSVRNNKEQAYLAYLIQSLKSDAWIGLHDTIEKGKYYWMDNSDITYTNWATGEPSILGINENCVKMKHDAVTSGVWENDVCSKKLPFICQMEKDPNIPKPPYSRDNQCIHPQGWLRLGVLCFKMFGGNTLTWNEAETACRRDGAELISITGTDVMAVANFLGTEVNQSYWIGLKQNVDHKFAWLNKWPVTLTRWGKNEPLFSPEKMCYASTSNGYWERKSCEERLPYICHITTGKPPPPPKRYTGECPKNNKDWKPTDGSYCLLPVTEGTSIDYYNAYVYCFSYGSYLASIHSLEDARIIKEAFGSDANKIGSVFIGLTKNEEGGFVWGDGSPVDYVNWDVDQPNSFENNEQCVVLNLNNLKWQGTPCNLKRDFACQSKKDREEEETPENAKLHSNSSSSVTTSTIIGVFVVAVVVLGLAVGVYFVRTCVGENRFRIPFRLVRSVSFDNALYNVDSTSIEFQDANNDLGDRR